jgi:hypothetical protein
MAALCLALAVAAATAASAQTDVDQALNFFKGGGAYCFRLVPEGVNMSDETEWTVMVLSGGPMKDDTFRIRMLEPGKTGMKGNALKEAGAAVTGVWRLDSRRAEFFERFAGGIDDGTLRARIVTIAPDGLAEATPNARAERYLRFADRGLKVSFKGVPDLTADAFRKYESYFPD